MFRRCGCRDDAGKTYGTLPDQATDAQRARACPSMLEDPKHGRWSFRLSAGFDPMTKKRRQVNGGTYPTKREAQQARNAAAVKLDQGKWLAPNRDTLAEYLEKWLERRSRVGAKGGKPLAPTTLENYRRYAEQDITPSRLGSMRLRDIRRGHVQAFIDDLTAAGRGAVTVRRIVAVIQGCLTSAVRDEIIDETPARLLELPAAGGKDFTPWEAEQVGAFLDHAAEHRLGALFEVAVFTGLRRAELVALAWTDVDLARRELRVRRDTTKTDAGRRRVALDDRAIGALVAWQIAQGAESAAWAAAYADSGRVFTMEDGRPLKLQYVTRLFDRLRAGAGLPPMTFHGLRHQQASLQLAAGTPLAVVSKRLGHSSVSVTADIYSHLLESTEHEAANAAASLVPARRVRARTVHAQGGENEEEAVPALRGNRL
ncbi:tyrosine-type recombinase/integrase [Nocardioides sp. SOB44]|uniref:Tyrosine-type recombinase/integrase n=1 Tax=Nocardioides cremeus TaxID=3058044 RepID=A0ABT8TWQ4_9ACTN|nr:tyrosine-type recombinase/integrase [Nocardioides cremeus]MDO3396991.1 tyrosine-type recombinase/integrase [Nocardioides cremeus]